MLDRNCHTCGFHVVPDKKPCGCLMALQVPKDHWGNKEVNAEKRHKDICISSTSARNLSQAEGLPTNIEKQGIVCEYYVPSSRRKTEE